jgi:hypothetical protein
VAVRSPGFAAATFSGVGVTVATAGFAAATVTGVALTGVAVAVGALGLAAARVTGVAVAGTDVGGTAVGAAGFAWATVTGVAVAGACLVGSGFAGAGVAVGACATLPPPAGPPGFAATAGVGGEVGAVVATGCVFVAVGATVAWLMAADAFAEATVELVLRPPLLRLSLLFPLLRRIVVVVIVVVCTRRVTDPRIGDWLLAAGCVAGRPRRSSVAMMTGAGVATTRGSGGTASRTTPAVVED